MTETNNTTADQRDKPESCPACGARDVKRIMHGYPYSGPPLKDDEVDGDGCVIRPDAPAWQCGSCRHRWGLWETEEYKHKARAVAENILWLAEHWGDSSEVRTAIDRAYASLALVGEVHVRLNICAQLYVHAKNGNLDPDSIREWIAVQTADPLNSVELDASKLKDETIVAAIRAWQRRKGERANGAPDKWTATLNLFRECGLANVARRALEKAWERHLKILE